MNLIRIFLWGAGQATIQLNPGLTLDNANTYQRGNDLAVVLDNGRDSLTIKDYYANGQSVSIALERCGNISHCGSLLGGIGLAENDHQWKDVA